MSSLPKEDFWRRHLALAIPVTPKVECFARQQILSSNDQKLSWKAPKTLQDVSLCFSLFSITFNPSSQENRKTGSGREVCTPAERPKKLDWWYWNAFFILRLIFQHLPYNHESTAMVKTESQLYFLWLLGAEKSQSCTASETRCSQLPLRTLVYRRSKVGQPAWVLITPSPVCSSGLVVCHCKS